MYMRLKKKTIGLWVLFLLLLANKSSYLLAQQASQYNFSVSTGNFTPIVTAVPVFTNADETITANQSIGFTFTYGGVNYNTFKISSNGFINLGGNLTSALLSNNLNSTTNHPIIAPLWDDLTSTALYEVTGTPGNQVLTVEWRDVKWKYSATNPGFSFQVKLYEADGTIEFIYGDQTDPGTTTKDASIGINTSPGGAGNFLNVNTDLITVSSTTAVTTIDTWPGLNTVYTFTPPTGDFQPPVIVNFGVDPVSNSCSPIDRDFFAHVTDNDQVQTVVLNYSVNGGPIQNVNMTLITGTTSDGNWEVSIPAANLNGIVTYSITATDASNNSVTSATQSFENVASFSVNAGNDQTINPGDNATLSASLSYSHLKITEVTLYNTGTGQTSPYPPYVPTSGDFVEISNLSNATYNLSGLTFEVVGTGARTYTFPLGTTLPGGGVLVLVLGTGTDQPANNLYFTGGANDALTSGSLSGFILKQGTQIIDAVAANGYTFLPSSGVTAGDWSGNIPSSSGKAGIIRTFSDSNTASDWVVSNSPAPLQTIGSLNPTLNVTNFTFTWTPGPLTGQTVIVTPSSTTTYTVSVTDGNCTVTDDVTINVNTIGQPPVVDFMASNTNVTTADQVVLTDLSTNSPNQWQWTITPNTFTFVSGNANSQNPVVQFNAAGTYTVKLVASNNFGSDSLTKTNYINVTLVYCTAGATSTADTDIGQFTFDAFSNGSATPVTNNPNATETYSDFTNLGPIQANINGIYPVSVSHITSGSTFYNAYIKVFIDYNQNGIFEVPSEVVLEGPTTSSAPTLTGNVTIPPTALLGLTRLRVVQREGGNTTNTEPCGTFTYGEVEDYTIEILPALPCTNPAVGGTASANQTTVHPNDPVIFDLTGYNGSVQWQYSTDGVNFMNIPGSTSVPDTLYASALGTFYVRAWVITPNCPPDSSNAVMINVIPRIGDTPANPKLITTNNYTDTDSTFGYTNQYTGPNNQTANDIFYQFVIPSCTDSININTCATTFDSYIHVLINGNHVQSDDDGCGGGVGVGSKIVLNSTQYNAGDTLTLIVEGYSGLQGTYTLNFTAYTSAPANPVASNDTICENNSATLTATGSTGTYIWYDVPTGGTALFTGSSFTTPLLNSTTTYYVEAVQGACTSSRVAVEVMVYSNPANPVVQNDTICAGNVANLMAMSNDSIIWYDAPNGNIIGTGYTFTTSILFNDTTFYVVATNGICSSNPVPVNVKVNQAGNITPMVPDTVQLGQPAPFAAMGGTSYFWNFGPNAMPDTASGPGPHLVTFMMPGLTTVTLYYTVECGQGLDSLVFPVFVEQSTSSANILFQNVSIYPNPNKGSFNLKAQLTQNTEVEFVIYNSIGQIVHQKLYSTTNVILDTYQLNLSSGVYTYKLISGKGIHYGKFIVE